MTHRVDRGTSDHLRRSLVELLESLGHQMPCRYYRWDEAAGVRRGTVQKLIRGDPKLNPPLSTWQRIIDAGLALSGRTDLAFRVCVVAFEPTPATGPRNFSRRIRAITATLPPKGSDL